MGIAARRKRLRADENNFKPDPKFDRRAHRSRLPADRRSGRNRQAPEGLHPPRETPPPQATRQSRRSAKRNRRRVSWSTDGATVLLPATVERQKAMPSALCMADSVEAENFAAAAAAANGPNAMARACTGFGWVASPRRMPRSTPRQTAVMKSLPETFPAFSARRVPAGMTVCSTCTRCDRR